MTLAKDAKAAKEEGDYAREDPRAATRRMEFDTLVYCGLPVCPS
jgi:hypothetical protein